MLSNRTYLSKPDRTELIYFSVKWHESAVARDLPARRPCRKSRNSKQRGPQPLGAAIYIKFLCRDVAFFQPTCTAQATPTLQSLSSPLGNSPACFSIFQEKGARSQSPASSEAGWCACCGCSASTRVTRCSNAPFTQCSLFGSHQ